MRRVGAGAERTLRTGLRWKASQSATVGVEATRGESDNKPTNAVMLRAHVRLQNEGAREAHRLNGEQGRGEASSRASP